MRNRNATRLSFVAFLTAMVALSPSSWGKITEKDTFTKVKITWHMPGDTSTGVAYAFPIDNEGLGKWNEFIDKKKEKGYEVKVNGVIDPSLAYSFSVTNPEVDPQSAFFSVDMPITSLAEANTVSAELTIELTDTNNDGLVSLERPNGFPGFQRAWIFKDDGSPIFNPSWDLAPSDITTPGTHTFRMEPGPGVIDPVADTLGLNVQFQLSPGDTAQFKGRVVIDDGSGAPAAEIPLLPSEGGACTYFPTITSPPTVIADRDTIGSCTTLNVIDGGTVGELVGAGAHGGGSIDTVVNVSGGTIGPRFLANAGSTVNISGGTIETGFSANDGSVVNISGGTIESLNANEGSELNLSGGTFGSFNSANAGSVTNLSGGTFESFIARAGSEVNVSGGRFTSNYLHSLEGAVVNVTGGEVAARPMVAHNGGQVNLVGSMFVLNGTPISNLPEGVPLVIEQRDVLLSGVFLDGTPFDLELCTEVCDSGLFQNDAVITVALGESGLLGDFNGDGILNAPDIDLLVGDDVRFDLTGNGAVDEQDRAFWVEDLAKTYFGDANLDGEFNSGDLVAVFKAAEYEDDISQNSTWADGDWNGDREFETGDLVLAFQSLGYERGPRGAKLVPEPSCFFWPALYLIATAIRMRRPPLD